MAERSKATVLKTVEAQVSVGSNPTPSASASVDHTAAAPHGRPSAVKLRN